MVLHYMEALVHKCRKRVGRCITHLKGGDHNIAACTGCSERCLEWPTKIITFMSNMKIGDARCDITKANSS